MATCLKTLVQAAPWQEMLHTESRFCQVELLCAVYWPVLNSVNIDLHIPSHKLLDEQDMAY